MVAILLGNLHHIRRDLNFVEVRAQVVSDPDQSFHLYQIHQTLESFGHTDGELYGAGVGAQFFHNGGGGHIEVRTYAVHLVDVGHAGNVVAVGLAPHGFGLGLHALHAVEYGNGAVEHAERPFHFGGEINVSGGVDDINDVVVPGGADSGGGDGYAALPFLGHPIGGGVAVVNLADLVGLAGIIEDTLGGCGFTRVDVGDNARVPHFCQIKVCHDVFLDLRFRIQDYYQR